MGQVKLTVSPFSHQGSLLEQRKGGGRGRVGALKGYFERSQGTERRVCMDRCRSEAGKQQALNATKCQCELMRKAAENQC